MLYPQILSTPIITTTTELLLFIYMLLLIVSEMKNPCVEKPDGYPQEVYTAGLTDAC
jgi:hypothetical protein